MVDCHIDIEKFTFKVWPIYYSYEKKNGKYFKMTNNFVCM